MKPSRAERSMMARMMKMCRRWVATRRRKRETEILRRQVERT
jgi:hypothetical protein